MAHKLERSKDCPKFCATDALECLKYNTYEAQRPIKPVRLRELRAKRDDGRLIKGEVAFAILPYESGRQVIVNGQHFCTIVGEIDDGRTFPTVIDYYTCQSEEDLQVLFDQFDDPKRTRTLTDIARTVAVRFRMEGFRPDVITNFINAVAWMNKVDPPKSDDGSDEAMTAVEFRTVGRAGRSQIVKAADADACKFIHGLITAVPRESSRHLVPYAVMAAIIKSFRKDPSDASDFWTSVRDGTGLANNNPQYVYREFLKNHVDDLRGTEGGRREIFIKGHHAWNAYRKAMTMSKLSYYSGNPRIPIMT